MLNVVDEQTETDGVDYSVSEDDAPSNCQLTSQSHTQLQLLEAVESFFDRNNPHS